MRGGGEVEVADNDDVAADDDVADNDDDVDFASDKKSPFYPSKTSSLRAYRVFRKFYLARLGPIIERARPWPRTSALARRVGSKNFDDCAGAAAPKTTTSLSLDEESTVL